MLNLVFYGWGIMIWLNIDGSSTRKKGNVMSKSMFWRVALRWLKDRQILL
jgi:hypothetical protein